MTPYFSQCPERTVILSAFSVFCRYAPTRRIWLRSSMPVLQSLSLHQDDRYENPRRVCYTRFSPLSPIAYISPSRRTASSAESSDLRIEVPHSGQTPLSFPRKSYLQFRQRERSFADCRRSHALVPTTPPSNKNNPTQKIKTRKPLRCSPISDPCKSPFFPETAMHRFYRSPTGLACF
jgi:hypothetical protein